MNLYDNLNNQEESNELQTQARSLRNMTAQQRLQSIDRKPIEQTLSERDAKIADYKQKYNGGFEISNEQYNFITKQLAKSEDPAADESKIAQAMLYSRNYGFDLEFTMDNLDALNEARFGKSNSYDISGFNKLKNSFEVGSLTVERGRAAEKYYYALQKGEDVTEYRNQIQALDAQIESLSEYVPKTAIGQLFNWGAQTIPYSGHILTASLAGAGVGSLVPAVGTALGTVAGFAEGFRLTKYSQFYDMVEAGVDKTIANWTSSLSGAIQAGVESFLGIESGLTRAITTGAKGIAGNVLGRAVANGTMNRIGLLASQYLINATAEGAEEFIQEVTSELADNIAYELSDMDIPYSSKDIIRNSLESAMAGFGSALILGVPATYFNNKATIKYADELKADSQKIDSKEAFIKKHLSDDTFADVNEIAKKEMLAKVYDQNHKTDVDLSTIDVADNINENFTEGELDEEGNEIQPETSPTLPEPKRLDNGRLRTQEAKQVRQNSDGTETHTLKIGSADSNTRYGYIEYSIDKENQSINIDKVAMARGQEALTREAIFELERPFEGWNFNWNPTSEAQIKIKDSIINDTANPNRGKLNWFTANTDVEANIKMADEIRKSFPNLTQQDALVATRLMEFSAQAEGLTTKDWLNNRIQSFGTKQMKDRGQINLDLGTLKAVVYAGEKADLSTFAHETFHAAILHTKYSTQLKNALSDAAKTEQFAKYVDTHKQIINMKSQDAINAISTMSDNVLEWTEAQNELAATLFECYLRDGKTFNENLKNLFQKIADLFHKIYRALKLEGALNDDVVKAYDAILAENPEMAKQLEQNEKKGTVTYSQQNNSDIGYQTEEEAEERLKEGIERIGGVKYEPDSTRMNISSVKELYALANDARAEFDSILTDLSEKLGLSKDQVSARSTLKKYKRVIEKTFNDYDGDIGRVIDANGWSFKYDTIEKAREAYNKSLEILGDSVVKHKALETAYGYKDFKINIKTSNGFIGELIILDENIAWAKKYGIGHSIYNEGRKLEPYLIGNSVESYQSLFGLDVWKKIEALNDALQEWSNKVYDNAAEIKEGQYDNAGFNANFRAVSSSMTQLVAQLRANFSVSENDGLSSTTLPSDVGLSIESAPVAPSLLKGVSQISKYLTDIDIASNSIMAQNDTSVNSGIRTYKQSLNYSNVEEQLKSDPKNFDAEGNHLAPNGKKSNLDYEQWVTVRTPEFKSWFGDWESDPENASKVVDNNGEPLVVYHGTDKTFDSFSLKKSSTPTLWFTDNQKKIEEGSVGAKGKGIIMDVFLKLSNPAGWDEYDKYGIQELKDRKYDGIKLESSSGTNYVAFNPNQIKSATGNNGDFNPSNVRIYNQKAYHGSGAEFEEFLDSKINSGQGSQRFGYGHYFAASDLVAKDYAKDTAFTEDKKQLMLSDAQRELENSQNDLAEIEDQIKQIESKSGEFYNDWLKKQESAYGYYSKTHDDLSFDEFLNNKEQALKNIIPSLKASIEVNKGAVESASRLNTQKRNLYKVDIPDTGYLNWDEVVPKKDVNKIVSELKNRIPKEEVKYFEKTYGLTDDITGEDLYYAIIDVLGSDQEASQFLNELGYTGITYRAGQINGVPQGAENTYNYVVFNPKDIKIEKSWQYDTDEEARQYNQIDPDPDVQSMMMVDAKRFATLEEYLDYQKDFFTAEQFEEDKADLENIWQRAHGLIEDNYESPVLIADSEEDKDNTFRAMIESDAGFETFVDYVREAFQIRRQVYYDGFHYSDASEAAFYDAKIAAADRFEIEASPFMTAIMVDKRAKDISEENRKKIRTTIKNRTRDYRSLFADIVNDQYLAVGHYTEYMPDILDPRATGMSIEQRYKLADKIEAEELRKAFRNGTEKIVDGKVEKALKSAETEVIEQKAEYQKLYDEYLYTVGKLGKSEKANLQKLEDQKKLQRQIANLEKTIRGKLDKGHMIDENTIKALNDKNDKLTLINEEVKAIRKQDREYGASKLKEKLTDLKKAIKEKEIEIANLEETKRYKRDMLTTLKAPISDKVDYTYAKQIEALQALVSDVSGYQNENITYEGKKYKLEDFRKAVDSGEIKIENFSSYQLKRYLGKSLADMTIAEMETLIDTRAYYENRGRQMWQAKVDQRAFESQQARAEIVNDLLKNPRYEDKGDLPNSKEEADRADSVGMKARGILYKTYNMESKAQILGNDSEDSLAYRKLRTEYNQHRDEEFANIDRREAPLMKLKEDLKLTDDDLYKPVEVNLGDKVQTFNPSVLNFLYYSQFNDKVRAAIAYGVLMKDEKSAIIRAYRNDRLASQEIQARGDARYKNFLAQATQYRAEHPELAKFADAVLDAMQQRGDALNQFSIDMWNKPVDLEEFYLPSFRKADDGTEVDGQLLNNLKNGYGGKLKTTPESGMLKSKIDISPIHQMPVNMDFFSIAFKAMEQQEHLLAFGKYVRELNDIFKARGSRDVRLSIQNVGGRALMQDIDNFINEAANPHFTSDVQGINPLIDSLRGNLYAGYLGFKMSGMVLQMITSPTAALQYVNPLQLSRSLMKMTGQYQKTIAAINARSPYMKSRSIDPTIEMIQKAAKQYGSSKWQNFISKETVLLEVADSWAVYAEWDAVYNKKLRELGDLTAENEKAAADYADYVVRKTQPDSDPARIAPLFKSKNAATKALLQFQTSLNVIWNQVAYNIDKTFNTFRNPEATAALKYKVFRETLGIMATYALAGGILTAVQNGGDDDEPKDVVKNLFYGMTTQFTSAVPLVGTYLDRLAEAAITGKKGYAYQTSFYPAIDKIISGTESLITMDKTDKDFEKKLKRALWNIGEGAALFEGLPVSGIKELGYTITKDGFKESLVNGDVDFTFNPSALLGRRDY